MNLNNRNRAPDQTVNTDSSWAFIRFLHDSRPHVDLAVIPATGGAPRCRSFTKKDKRICTNFLAQEATANIYYQINSTVKRVRRKAKKQDIAKVDFLHVDVDPNGDHPLEEEQERILNLLKDPPDPVPKPSLIVFSGGGYQALWKLEVPVVIDGDQAKIVEVESRNRWLADQLGGDHCFNVDRLLRLPGTLNFPNEKKKAQGRRIARAEVVFP
jgi:hypothetical protein